MKTREEYIQKAMDALPKEYLDAVSSLQLTDKVNELASNINLDREQAAILDKEVAYMVLRMIEPAEFTKRLDNQLGVSDEIIMTIINSVTNNILKQLQKELGQDGAPATESIPVPPPPPEAGTPSPSYGGVTDPYQEPKE